MGCTGAKNNEELWRVNSVFTQESALSIKYIMGSGVRFEFPGITVLRADIFFRIWNLLSGLFVQSIDWRRYFMYSAQDAGAYNNALSYFPYCLQVSPEYFDLPSPGLSPFQD